MGFLSCYFYFFYCNGFNPIEINSSSKQLVNKVKSFTKEELNEFLSEVNNETKDNGYYSRINAIGIYELVSELPSLKDGKDEEINKEINNISELLGYQYSRVEKDISMYKSNIEKMKQALEIISLNLTSNKN